MTPGETGGKKPTKKTNNKQNNNKNLHTSEGKIHQASKTASLLYNLWLIIFYFADQWTVQKIDTHLQNLKAGNMSQPFPQDDFSFSTYSSLSRSPTPTPPSWTALLSSTESWTQLHETKVGGRHPHTKPYPWHKSLPCSPVYQLTSMKKKRLIQRRGSDKWATSYPGRFSLVQRKYHLLVYS